MNDSRFRHLAAALLMVPGCASEICPPGDASSTNMDLCQPSDAGAPDALSPVDMPDAGMTGPDVSLPLVPRPDGGYYPRTLEPIHWFDVTGLMQADFDAPVTAINPAPGKILIYWAHGGKIRTSRRTSSVGTFSEARDLTDARAIGRSGRITAIPVDFNSARLFWATEQGAVRAMADPWSDSLGGEYSWLELAPSGAAARNAKVAAVASSRESLSAYWIGPYGAIQERRQIDSKSGWLPVEEIVPAGVAVEPYITAVRAREQAVQLFFLVRAASDTSIIGTKLETMDASPRWSPTCMLLPPTFLPAARVDISTVADRMPGRDSLTTLVYPTPRGSFNGAVLRCDARDAGSNTCSTSYSADSAYNIPVTSVTAVTGDQNTYVFVRHSDNSLRMVCQPSCGGPFLIAGQYEIPSGAEVTAVADQGRPGLVTLFYTRADGTVRAANVRGP